MISWLDDLNAIFFLTVVQLIRPRLDWPEAVGPPGAFNAYHFQSQATWCIIDQGDTPLDSPDTGSQ